MLYSASISQAGNYHQRRPTGPLDARAELIFYTLLSLSIAAALFIGIDEGFRCVHPDNIKPLRFQQLCYINDWLYISDVY